MTSPILSIQHLTVNYRETRAILDISLDIERGDSVAIIGPNGAGKSTLIKAVMDLIPIQGGKIIYADAPRPIGYVPQQENINWNFPVTVRDVVMMGSPHRSRFGSNTDAWKAVDEALERVELLPFRDRQVGELSGGQRRRVFIARTLVQETDLLILDEPFSGVDVSAQAGLMEVLDRLNAEGLTILLSTHDLDLAFNRFKKVLALRHEVIGWGTPNEVYTSENLARLYDRQVVTLRDGAQAQVYVDEHGCVGHGE